MSAADLIVAILIWTAIIVGASLLLMGYLVAGHLGSSPSTREPLWLGGALILAGLLTAVGRSRRGSDPD